MRKSLLLILCLGVLSVLLVSCGTGQAYLVSPCSDSDGGKNPDVAGTLKFKSGLTQKSYTDSCTSPKGVISKNGTALVEYYCALRSFATETMKCQYGCEDGACKPAPTFMINVVDQTVCGDGMVQGTEQCDDGNTISGDGCSGTCLNETP